MGRSFKIDIPGNLLYTFRLGIFRRRSQLLRSVPECCLFTGNLRGTPTEDSDIDLFIVKDDDRKSMDRFCEVRKLSRDVNGVSVMPIVFTHNELERRLKSGG